MNALPLGYREERQLAYHEAAHAVAHYRFGRPFEDVTIQRVGGEHPTVRQLSIPDFDLSTADGRALVEEHLMILHAGAVAERIVDPGVKLHWGGHDHRALHALSGSLHFSADVVTAHCIYLWQRTYDFIAKPAQFHLVSRLAIWLLNYGSISGDQAIELFHTLEREVATGEEQERRHLPLQPSRPRCPWHRRWSITDQRSGAAMDLSPLLAETLSGLPRHAWSALERAGILTVDDLAEWSEHALYSIKGVGKKTARIIVESERFSCTDNCVNPGMRCCRWRNAVVSISGSANAGGVVCTGASRSVAVNVAAVSASSAVTAGEAEVCRSSLDMVS